MSNELLDNDGNPLKRYHDGRKYRVGRPWEITCHTTREVAEEIFDLARDGLSLTQINEAMGRPRKTRVPSRLLSDPVFFDPYVDEVVVERILRGSDDLEELLEKVTFYEWQVIEQDLLRREPWLIDRYHDILRADEREAWVKLPVGVRDNVYRQRPVAAAAQKRRSAKWNRVRPDRQSAEAAA